MFDALRNTIILVVIAALMLLIPGGIVITMIYGHWDYIIGEIFIIFFAIVLSYVYAE
jgi:glucose dehydrogenase